MNQLVHFVAHASPGLVAAAGINAELRFLEFFSANIRNPHTRRAYAQATREFLSWCEMAGVPSIAVVRPIHVASYVEQLSRERSAPTAKQRLAAIRHLFDWLVVGQVIPTNPAASVRGPKHIVKKGKTPVLSPKEARKLLETIDVSTQAGLRDRALIGLMVYSFARIGAALAMKVDDVYVQNRRLWVRLHEKGGKRHEMPCHHNLESYLEAYLDGSGIRQDPRGPLFRTIGRNTRMLTRTPLPQANAYAMIRRRAAAAGIKTRIGNHTFRATGSRLI
jgi:site-specific recombinase XerD